MYKFITVLVIAVAVVTVLYQNKVKLESYSAGCIDVYTDLYTQLGLNNLDKQSLKDFCANRAQTYVRW